MDGGDCRIIWVWISEFLPRDKIENLSPIFYLAKLRIHENTLSIALLTYTHPFFWTARNTPLTHLITLMFTGPHPTDKQGFSCSSQHLTVLQLESHRSQTGNAVKTPSYQSFSLPEDNFLTCLLPTNFSCSISTDLNHLLQKQEAQHSLPPPLIARGVHQHRWWLTPAPVPVDFLEARLVTAGCEQPALQNPAIWLQLKEMHKFGHGWC